MDAKDFGVALNDFDAALRLTPADAQLDRGRLLAGRGLAFEGISSWVDAVAVGGLGGWVDGWVRVFKGIAAGRTQWR